MVNIKLLKVFYAAHNSEMCSICDRVMFGNNLYDILFVLKNLSSEEKCPLRSWVGAG